MLTINRSNGKDNWSQLKNLDEPLSTCNVTACINALQSCGYDIMALRKSTNPNKRPSDDLYEFMQSDSRVQGFYARNTDKALPPNQYMEVLAYAVGLWIGDPSKVEWHSALPIKMIATHIIKSGCAVVHGHYPTTTHDIDHITAFVGMNYGITYDQTGAIDKIDIVSIIDDDSYGDPWSKYQVKMGNDILYTPDQITQTIKPIGDALRKDAILIFNKE